MLTGILFLNRSDQGSLCCHHCQNRILVVEEGKGWSYHCHLQTESPRVGEYLAGGLAQQLAADASWVEVYRERPYSCVSFVRGMDAFLLGSVRFQPRFRGSQAATRGRFWSVGYGRTAEVLSSVIPVHAAVSPIRSNSRGRLDRWDDFVGR